MQPSNTLHESISGIASYLLKKHQASLTDKELTRLACCTEQASNLSLHLSVLLEGIAAYVLSDTQGPDGGIDIAYFNDREYLTSTLLFFKDTADNIRELIEAGRLAASIQATRKSEGAK